MTTEPSSVELLVPGDDRLLAAVETVLAHASEEAGLSEDEFRDLHRSVSEACEDAFSFASRNGNANPILHLTVSDFPNRVEVSIEPSEGETTGQPLASRSVRNMQKPDVVDAALHDMNLDHLHHDLHAGRPRTVLVKYHATPNAQGHR